MRGCVRELMRMMVLGKVQAESMKRIVDELRNVVGVDPFEELDINAL